MSLFVLDCNNLYRSIFFLFVKVWLKRIGLVAGSVKGPWSPEEDALLSRLVAQFGARNWGMIARGVPGRSSKSCRLRWCNQLDPCLKRKPFTGN